MGSRGKATMRLFLCIFAIMSLSFNIIADDDIGNIITDLQKGELENVSIFSHATGEFIEINKAYSPVRILLNNLNPDSISKTSSSSSRYPQKLKITLKNKTIAILEFGHLWSARVNILNDSYLIKIKHDYDTKISLLALSALSFTSGELERPPILPDWFNLEFKKFLSGYFSDINSAFPLPVKRLAFLFESTGFKKVKSKNVSDCYGFYAGETIKDQVYLKNLMSFLKEKNYNISFEDYASIVYPFYVKYPNIPVLIPYPNGSDPLRIINLLKDENNIAKIEIAGHGLQQYNYYPEKTEILQLSQTFKIELFPEQEPCFTYSLFLPQIKIRLLATDKEIYNICLGKALGYRYWGIFNGKDENNRLDWIFYSTNPGESERFDKLYDKIFKSLKDH